MNIQDIVALFLENASPENIKMYRELSMMFHPDRNPEGAEKMSRLNALKDAENWDAIKRMYMKHIGLEDESEHKFEKPNKPSELLRFYKNLSDEIEEDLATETATYGIKIVPELQGNSVNCWVNFLKNEQGPRGQIYIPKIDRFKTKNELKAEIMKKLGIRSKPKTY